MENALFFLHLFFARLSLNLCVCSICGYFVNVRNPHFVTWAFQIEDRAVPLPNYFFFFHIQQAITFSVHGLIADHMANLKLFKRNLSFALNFLGRADLLPHTKQIYLK